MLSLLKGVARMMPMQVWIALLALVLSIGGWIVNRYTIDKVRAQRDQAIALAEKASSARDAWMNVAFQRTRELNLEREERAAGETATRELNNDLDTLDERYRPSAERIRLAPESDDAPVAPVLRQAIEDLP
ncbi:hypothetical protein QO259_10345 [Salinicola sp. JS01]|uniref:hypothetical protein n=1 Tax=Salinicola sp. JS01 TaxID=3050071 RepID=UPI00255B4C48|nr:hypothetical protein [Salinicola sp. JS01]WIX31234.1 hypothetical protein QO259_10345 [Salinicola sp. JS01]